jgi:hypothetical protein
MIGQLSVRAPEAKHDRLARLRRTDIRPRGRVTMATHSRPKVGATLGMFF